MHTFLLVIMLFAFQSPKKIHPKKKTQQMKKRERVKMDNEKKEVSSDGNVNIPAKRQKNRLRRRC